MKYIYLFTLTLLTQAALAQTKLLVIKATTKNVSINDGGFLDKNAWSLSPKIRPDVFTADRTRKAKWVTFYTNIDSIKVKVKPGSRFNFVVLLNGTDSCFTQIASAIPPINKDQPQSFKADTIPFVLTAFNAISVKAILNNTDTLNLHFDASSFDFHLTRDAILKKTKLLANQPDALAGKNKPNFNNLDKTFKLQMGSAVWNNPDVLPTVITSTGMDGRFGWNLFEGRQVEINYDSNLLIIHPKLPKALKGYVRSKIEFTRSYPHVKGKFIIAGKTFEGDFSMDMGSNEAVIVDAGWATRQNFSNGLKLIRSTTLSDPLGVKYPINIVEAPQFTLNTFGITNVPTLVLADKNPSGYEINYLGNDILKRFNIILDFKKDYLYLKPNKLMGSKYGENGVKS